MQRRDSEALATELGLAIQMRALTHFYVKAVHDLKAPLNTIVVTLELLSDALRAQPDDDGEVTARRQRYLETFRREIARLNGSVQSLVAQTPLLTETSRAVDLRELLQDVVTLLAPQAAKRKITVELRRGDPLPVVGKRDQLRQALLNVGITALETMAEGGRMELAGGIVNGKVTASVDHDGPAMPAEIRADIYEPCIVTAAGDRVPGLYVARAIAKAHGGQVRLDVEGRAGACIRVALPCAAAGERSAEC